VVGLAIAAGCGRFDFDPLASGDAAGSGSSIARCGFVEITTGRDHTCARRADGTVACWGGDYAGQLDGVLGPPQLTPIDVALPGPATTIDAGAFHTCALLGDGGVVCWGENSSGQLGDASGVAHGGIVQVLPAGSAAELSVGSYHACTRDTAGAVTCWGINVNGEIGTGALTAMEPPTPVAGITGALSIGTGHHESCAVLGDRTVKCWGANNDAQLGLGGTGASHSTPTVMPGLANIATMTGGGRHLCAVGTDGSVECAGKSNNGQTGIGSTSSSLNWTQPVAIGPVRQLATGSRHNCALLVDGRVQCWGRGSDGALGNGSLDSRALAPVTVALPSTPIAIGGGYRHTCVLLADGTPRCWGSNDSGQLGDGTRSIVQAPVVVMTGASSISAGVSGGCAMSAPGIQCWGENEASLLGNNSFVGSPTPVAVTLAGAATVIAGGDHVCALDGTDQVFCWGSNWSSQLGTTAGADSSSPALANKPGIGSRAEIGVGNSHTCGLQSGSVLCWGFNFAGQLGDGTTTGVGPVAAQGLTTVATLILGEHSSYAILADGTLRGWGDNSSGRLGDGTTTSRSVPTSIASAVVSPSRLAAARGHSCAIDNVGQAWCWGENDSGQVGDGTTTQQLSPVKVVGLPAVKEIAVGIVHTCAMEASGTVWCWGNNELGELGDTSWPGHGAPAVVAGLPPVIAISAHGYFTCAMTSNGDVWCWGENDKGQVGASVAHGTTPSAPSCTP